MTFSQKHASLLESEHLFESDIKLTAEQRTEMRRATSEGKTGYGQRSRRAKRKAIAFWGHYWSNGQMPYEIDPSAGRSLSHFSSQLDLTRFISHENLYCKDPA